MKSGSTCENLAMKILDNLYDALTRNSYNESIQKCVINIYFPFS